MITEDDAKAKWCPFVRVFPSTERTHGGTNREDRLTGTPGEVSRCIGSACMAWRWQDVSGPYDDLDEAMDEPPYGYCGLAGKPA